MIKRKTILILGATGGIGKAISKSLSRNNNQLLLHGNNKNKLASMERELDQMDVNINSYQVDLSNPKSVTEFTNELCNKYPEIDWIINTAGYINEDEKKGEQSISSIERTFYINTIAPIYLTERIKKNITDVGGVIMISSTASLSANPGFPIYSASKSALNTFTKSLSKQFLNMNKSAFVICPGGTNTTMRERVAGDSLLQQHPNVIAAEISKIIDGLSEFKNGDIIIIKNGFVNKEGL
ncbi:MAG: SDR family NAD(P)-dependent oxidoreductase [Patescibacteria group bacterium UBA2163]